ncbi:hypothetical protein Tco_0127447 [Tanacetum coccineum]
MTSRRPSILNRSSTQTQTELPTQEDQIRGYRQMARNRHQVARTTRRVFGRSNYNRTLETAVDPERQLEISRERRANLVPAEVLYSNNRSTARHRDFSNPLGIFIDKATRTPPEERTQLVYTFPDMILSVNDFHNHVEVAIQTHGYDTWQGGESNLLITMALTGRLSNTSYMGFQYSVENVVDHLTTTGITAIPGIGMAEQRDKSLNSLASAASLHISEKIVNFNEEELKTKKGLRSFLGILNYARNHIPKLGILLRPLYEKTNAHGDKRLKPSDYEFE